MKLPILTLVPETEFALYQISAKNKSIAKNNTFIYLAKTNFPSNITK